MVWSGRDIGRHPAQAVLVFLSISTLTALVAIVLILHQAVTETFDGLLEHSPAMVVRRVGSGGWMPLPMGPALSAVQSVPGVVRPRTRIWGVVSAGGEPVTIVGLEKGMDFQLPEALEMPLPGEAWLGPGIRQPESDGRILLIGQQTLALKIRGRLPESAAMAVHDVLLLHADDARQLLGLKKDQASDLVLDVFHGEEAGPLAQELSSVFPWPVQVTTRQAVRTAYSAHFAARGATGLLSFIPALLALVLLVFAVGMWGVQHRPDVGLMKAMGWTGGDVLGLHLIRAIIVGCPAFITGALGACCVCFFPLGNWLTRLLFDWSGPPLNLDPRWAATALALAVVMVFLPYLVTCFWSGWQAVQADPMELIQGR
jgi:hypothetical protein